jgi:hypothetical protein
MGSEPRCAPETPDFPKTQFNVPGPLGKAHPQDPNQTQNRKGKPCPGLGVCGYSADSTRQGGKRRFFPAV